MATNPQNYTGVVLVSGSDEAEVGKAARKLVEQVAGVDPDPFAFDLVRETDDIGAAQALDQAIRSIMSPPFIGDRKTVWLKDFSGIADEKKTGPLGRSLERLCEIINNGAPSDICFIISGPGIDKRKALYKTIKKTGKVILHDKPDSRSKGWQRQVAGIIEAAARERSATIDQDAVQCLIDAVGTDTARVATEMDKLAAFVGGEAPRITLTAVQTMCSGDGETVWWAVKDTIGARRLESTLRTTEEVLRNERNEDSVLLLLIKQTGHYFREMLQTRVAMKKQQVRHPRQLQNALEGMGKDEIARICEEDGLDFLDKHPFRVFKTAEAAMNFTDAELAKGMELARNAYWKCMSNALVSNRVLWENLVYSVLPRQRSK